MSGGRWTVQEVAESKSMSNFHFHFYTTSNILCPLASMIVYGIPQKNLTRCITLAFSNMYGCESWTVKKVEHQRIDAFELWCWRRLLRVPWAGKETQPVHSEGDQPWDFFGRNDAKAEAPVLWPPHAKS